MTANANEAKALALLEARMMSGEPFTYGMLCVVSQGLQQGRLADRTIQKWRKNGWIKMDGRIGRAPRWVYVEGSKPAA